MEFSQMHAHKQTNVPVCRVTLVVWIAHMRSRRHALVYPELHDGDVVERSSTPRLEHHTCGLARNVSLRQEIVSKGGLDKSVFVVLCKSLL